MDLSLTPVLDFARDMFLMSFYLRGMSFIDMAFLKKTDLKNGYITYRRRKTGPQLIIEWAKEIKMILDKYPKNKSDYLLPVIRKPGINERCTYRNVGYNINHNSKTIVGMVGVTIPLTLCVGFVTAGLPPQMTSHTSIRHLRGHGTRQRSNHPNLPRRPRHLRC